MESSAAETGSTAVEHNWNIDNDQEGSGRDSNVDKSLIVASRALIDKNFAICCL